MSKNKSIRLHKEYGLNPTISICIICGKDTGDLALLGAAYKDKAPMHMITSIEPCKECKEEYLTKGILLIESSEENKKKPTGNMAVVKTEAFTKIFNIPIPKDHICFIETGLLAKIGITKDVNI